MLYFDLWLQSSLTSVNGLRSRSFTSFLYSASSHKSSYIKGSSSAKIKKINKSRVNDTYLLFLQDAVIMARMPSDVRVLSFVYFL